MAKDNEKNEDKTDQIWSDPRFANLVNDPRFKSLPKSQKKVKIDKRFQPMFENENFKLKYSIDKRGKKVNTTTSKDLKKYYDLSEESDEEEIQKESADEKPDDETESDEFGNSLLDRGDLAQDIKSKLKNLEVDYARGNFFLQESDHHCNFKLLFSILGDAALVSDSSSDEESSGEDDNELILDHVWGELDTDAPRTEESTRRIAACNMDWDRIRAVDIMVLCHSFLPPGGVVQKVSVTLKKILKEW